MIQFRAGLIGLAVVAFICSGVAQDDPDAKRRLEWMQQAVKSLEASPTEGQPMAEYAAAAKPLLRYNDPTRGGVKEQSANNVLLDAGLWRLGTTGRPKAIVTLEIYEERDGSHVLSFEFLSLTDSRFSLKHKSRPVRWDATASPGLC